MADESSPVCVAPNAESGPSDSSEGQGRSSSDSCYVDTTYIRSIEGILKLVSLVSSPAITNLLATAGYINSSTCMCSAG